MLGKLLMKALVISIGTGVSLSKRAVESLAEAIVFSIKHHNPDKTYFVVSEESLKRSVPLILGNVKPRECEIIKIEDPDDIQEIYETLRQKFNEIRIEFDQLTVDYTFGTKAMTSALTILGTIYEADTLSYIAGKRLGDILQPGTEK